MSADDEKPRSSSSDVELKQQPSAKVLTITRPAPSCPNTPKLLSTVHDSDSAHSFTPPATPNTEKLPDASYTLYRARTDMYGDLEAQGLTGPTKGASQSKSSMLQQKCGNIDSAWPGRNYMKQQRKEMKLQRARCTCWARLSKLHKGLIVSTILLAVLGIALGLGFGLSRKVGGTVYTGAGGHKPVP